MITKATLANYLLEHFGEGHRDVLIQTDALMQVLTNLNYEGKPSLGKNLKQMNKILHYFNGPFKKHMQIEEEIVYPFFERHVPKFESVMTLLQSEHKDIRRRLGQISALLRKLSVHCENTKCEKLKEKIDSEGTYFVYLLQNHIRTESETVFKTIVRHLNQAEIEALAAEIKERENE